MPQSDDVDVSACRKTVVDFVRCVCMAVSNDVVLGVSQLASLVPVVGWVREGALGQRLVQLLRVCLKLMVPQVNSNVRAGGPLTVVAH